jgi:catechol 2,3-dioxygenase-like lactoylglutathione lyase family enzyme
LRITAIDHVGIAVPDLDAAIEHYTSVYGMTCVHQEVNEEQGVREAMMAVGSSRWPTGSTRSTRSASTCAARA